MNDDKNLDELETQLTPTPELVTDDVPTEEADVTEEVAKAMDK